MCTCFSYVPAQCQQNSACQSIEGKASSLVDNSNFLKAHKLYSQAKDCYKTEGLSEEFVDAAFLALDCLSKGFEYKQLQKETADLNTFLNLHRDEFHDTIFDVFESAVDLFEVKNLIARGNTQGALEQLDALIVKFEEKTTTKNSDFWFKRLIQSFMIRAVVRLKSGDYNQAIFDNQEALDRMQPYLETYVSDGIILGPHLVMADCYAALGQIERVMAEYDSVRRYIPQITQKLDERGFNAYATIFNFYLETDLDSAEIYLGRINALQLSEHTVEILQMTGALRFAKGAYHEAERPYLRALEVIEQRQGDKYDAAALTNLMLGKLQFYQQNPGVALGYLHSALLALTDPFQDSNPLSTPPDSALYHQRNLLEILLYKTITLRALYREAPDSNYLVAAWQTIQLSVHFLNKLRLGYLATEDRRLIIDQSYPIFEQALELTLTFKALKQDDSWVDTAFVLMEQSKALNLLDAVLHERAKQFAGIPDSLLTLEAELKQEIAERAGALRTYRDRADIDIDQSVEQHLQDVLTHAESRYQILVRRIERDHPEYYRLKHVDETITLTDVQSMLRPDQSLVEYFMGDNSVYAVKIEHDRKLLLPLTTRGNLDTIVETLRGSLLEYVKTKNTASDYEVAAHRLYTMLLKPLDTLGHSIIIIPDGVLGLVSFAGLLNAPAPEHPDLRKLPYVLWDHDISYCYSANLLRELQRPTVSNKCIVLACAPTFASRQALTYSVEEAQQVKRIVGGTTLLREECTAQAVRDALAIGHKYGIVHFATHGHADTQDGQESYIVLAGDQIENRLYARDLYNMQLNTHLVYLAACETGAGELQRGEGIISFARAFFYAGTKSLVTALWRIEDRSALVLTKSFYRNLRKGMSKDAAVAEAQRKYLTRLSKEKRTEAHPVYWSALVPIGSVVPLDLSARLPFWIWFVAVLPVLFWIYRKLFSKKMA